MKIVLVVDSFADKSNGTSMTAARFCDALRARGHEVRVVAPYINGEHMYRVKERYIPLVTEISHAQHMMFGTPDEKVLERAFEGADVVHLFLPFKLEIVAAKVAKRMKIPYIAAFHLQPEHVTYNIGLQKVALLNRFIFWLFKYRFYRHISHIHCPSKLIKEEIERAGYGGEKFVISNGFDPKFAPRETPLVAPAGMVGDSGALTDSSAGDSVTSHASDISSASSDASNFGDGFYHITMVGRYSKEKRQDLIIKAIAQNPYKNRIKLHLKGIGPIEPKLKKFAKILPNEVDFGFVAPEELVKVLHGTHLYIHAADVEGEAIACLEAVGCGIVPIISDSKISATGQFALDNRSLFRAGDANDLSEKISYWIEHEEERLQMSAQYAASAQNYTLESSIKKAIEMYKKAIDFYKQK